MKKVLILAVMLVSVLAMGFSQTTLSGTYRYSTNANITFTGNTFTGSWNATSPISGTYTVSGSRLTLNIKGGTKSPDTWVWTIVDPNTLKDQDGDSWGLVSVRSQSVPSAGTASAQSINNTEAQDKDTSYAFGMLMANQLIGQLGITGLHFDYDAFKEGFRDISEARETRLTQEKATEKINAAFSKFQARQDEVRQLEGKKNLEEGEAYLAANRERGKVITTSSGLQYEVLIEGRGEKPKLEDTVRVHYEGAFINGSVFDSSFQRGKPNEFPLEYVIPGFA
jgi:FKBP-type peptidyl-prolyl cis-trans isomerase